MELVVPFTGEVVSMDDPGHCARVIKEIRELEANLRELKGYLGQSLMEESRRQGTKTMHFPGLEVKINTPSEIAWDREILLELMDLGLPEERFDALVTMEVQYKVNGLVAKSIGASNPVYAEVLARAQTRVPKSPSVTVNEKKGAQ
jgi:hypothetical protein